MSSLKRIQAEWNDIRQNPICDFSVSVINNDIYNWEARICGPEDSPYEGGVFHLKINFPNNYPFKPPKITFITKIYHCNIDVQGEICLDILKEHWSPALTISKVLLSICSLLNDPNPDDPLNLDIGILYRRNRKKYNEIAKEYTIKYAIENNLF